MNTKKKMTGFTLLEIMIAVAIIGILGAVAMPSYTKYVKRAKATEIVVLYETMKLHIISHHIETGEWPSGSGNLNARNYGVGLAHTSAYTSDVIQKAWVGPGGVAGNSDSAHIAISYKDGDLRNPPNSRGGRFIAVIERVNGRYVGTCNATSSVHKSDMNYDYLPERCHN